METTTDLINETAEYVKRTLQGDATGHDWWHVFRVWQMATRLARETGKSEAEIEEILAGAARGRFLGLFGEPRVNVLQVNLQLEK